MQVLAVLTALLLQTVAGCDLEQFFREKQVSVEESVATSQVVFRGLSSVAAPESAYNERGASAAYFQLINTYKGVDYLNAWDTTNYRYVNVSFFGRNPDCSSLATSPQEYIVFCNLVDQELEATSIVKWDETADQRIWKTLGWGSWSDWSSCSVSCSTGIQQRIRHCLRDKCPGYNVEQRLCNLFGCPDTVNPLNLKEMKLFHPSKDKWEKVPERPTAWRLNATSYIWVPSVQLFPTLKERSFPKEFTLYLTLRLFNNSNIGTIFSLRSRTRQDTYLSLEIAGFDLKLVHATANGTDMLRIPTTLSDQRWHQIAIGIRDDSVIETYLDCEWSRTDILKQGSISIPNDSDLIIGYLFSGDIDQLSLVSDPRMVSLQCSPLTTPIVDPTIKDSRFQHKFSQKRTKKYRKSHKRVL